jgi:thymidylate kinase
LRWNWRKLIKQIEIVVDGTDCGGKTPLVESLVSELTDLGHSVATLAPFREVEVYPLWEDDPLAASRTVARVMQHFREENCNARIVVWDRGWPTVHASTYCPDARECVSPYPDWTILLLNTESTILEKIQKYRLNGLWLTNQEIRRRYLNAYNRVSENDEAPIKIYRANSNGRFDIGNIVTETIKRFEQQGTIHHGS